MLFNRSGYVLNFSTNDFDVFATILSEIRSPFGSGHGKSTSFERLEERHAKLAVESSITFVDFTQNTFKNQQQTGTKVIWIGLSIKISDFKIYKR